MSRISKYIAPTRKPKESGETTVIILGSKPNYKMRTFGSPSLYKINGKTLIEHQIETLRKINPNIEIIVTSGYFADKVLKKLPEKVRLIENCQFETTNECEDLRLALNIIINSRVIIIGSSLLFNEQVIPPLLNCPSCFIIDYGKQIEPEELGLTVVDKKPTIFSYGISSPKWTHIAVFVEKELTLLRQLCNRDQNKKFLFELYNLLLEKISMVTLDIPSMKVSLVNTSKGLLNENTDRK